jgi:hypothetical protein
MRRALLTAILATAAVLVAVLSASANSSSHSDPSGDLFGDPTEVSNSSVDIIRATVGHRRGNLVHTVSVAGTVGAVGASNAPVLFLEHPTQPNGTAECAYYVGRRNGVNGVFKCGYGTRVTSARITRTSSRTMRFEFSPKFLNNPENYEWAARTRARTTYSVSAWVDRLPSGNNEFLTHELR